MFQRWSSNASNCTDEIRSVHIRFYSQTGKCVGAHLLPFSLSVV